MPAIGKGFGIGFSHDLCHAAGFKYQCSYLNILQASLLHACLDDKAKHSLMQVQACSLCTGHKETCSTSIKGLKWGLVSAARAVRLQMWERHVAVNRHQGLHYTDFSDQKDPPMDDVALFRGAHIRKAL